MSETIFSEDASVASVAIEENYLDVLAVPTVDTPGDPSVVPPVAEQMQPAAPDVPANASEVVVAPEMTDAEYFGFDAKAQASFDKEFAALIEDGGKLYAGDTMSHIRFGKRVYNHIRMAKTSMDVRRSKTGSGSEFKDTDHDYVCGQISEQAERKNAIGRDGKKTQVRVIDDIRAFQWSECVIPIVGALAVKTLPWSVVNTYLAPKSLDYNKKTMASKIKLDWVDFVRDWVSNFSTFGEAGTTFEGKTNFREYLTAAIKDHEAALKAIRDGKKTEEQLASAASAKKTQDAKKLKDRVLTFLCTSLSNAVAGPCTLQEVADAITVTMKGMERELPLTVTAASMMDAEQLIQLLGSVATSADVSRFCKTLFSANKVEQLDLMSTYAAILVKASSPEPVLPPVLPPVLSIAA